MAALTADLIGKLEASEASIVVTTVFAQLGRLPALPENYSRLVQSLEDPKCDADTVASILSRDPGLAGRVLQVANSALFGQAGRVVALPDAVRVTGLQTLRSLVLAEGALRSFPTALHAPLTLERLWRHAVETARLAKAFARAGGMQGEEVESAFTAGLLHDIGRLVLAEAHGENYFVTLRSSRDDGVPMLICERGTYDCDHADVGGSMLRFWNLPKAVAEAVRWHHEPSRSYAGFSLAMAVHLADVLAHAKPGIAAYTPGVLDEVHTAACGLPVELGALERLAQDAER